MYTAARPTSTYTTLANTDPAPNTNATKSIFKAPTNPQFKPPTTTNTNTTTSTTLMPFIKHPRIKKIMKKHNKRAILIKISPLSLP